MVFFLVYGRNVYTLMDPNIMDDKEKTGKQTVTYEARLLKHFLLKLQYY